MTETIETNRDWHSHWASVGERTGRDELLRQVERTIGGIPIPESQLDLLVAAITRRLSLGPEDVLLDLCCGNGLITARLAPLCRLVVGVDFSAELISIARERHPLPNTVYICRSADDLQPADFPAAPPNKACMNFSLQHFTVAMAGRLLGSLRALAPRGLTFYVNDVPDADRIFAFYNTPERRAEFERRRAAGTEAIGTWWNRAQLRSLFEAAGFAVEITDPEPERSTAHYRFDVLARLID
jgi:ubiquinone/menaquinone biosynthesis C-methylase UbiE